MQASIGGSAKIQGTAATAGLIDATSNGNSGVSRAMIFWGIAFGVLVIFHVGGARI